MKPKESRGSLEAILSECVAELAATGEGAALDVDLALEEKLPAVVGSHALIRRLLHDACRIAAEAMPSGGALSIRARLLSTGAAGPAVRVLIRDTGEGHDAEAIARIRRESPRAPRSGVERRLASVRERAQRLGGAMHLVSARACGTSVVIDLPVAGGASNGVGREPTARAAVLSFRREVA